MASSKKTNTVKKKPKPSAHHVDSVPDKAMPGNRREGRSTKPLSTPKVVHTQSTQEWAPTRGPGHASYTQPQGREPDARDQDNFFADPQETPMSSQQPPTPGETPSTKRRRGLDQFEVHLHSVISHVAVHLRQYSVLEDPVNTNRQWEAHGATLWAQGWAKIYPGRPVEPLTPKILQYVRPITASKSPELIDNRPANSPNKRCPT